MQTGMGVRGMGVRFKGEAKTGAGRQSPEQRQRQANIGRVGGAYIAFRSVADLLAKLPREIERAA